MQKWKQSKLSSSNSSQKTLSRLRRGSYQEAEKLVLEFSKSCSHAHISQKLSAQEVVRAQNIAQQEIKARNSCCVRTVCHNGFCLRQRTSLYQHVRPAFTEKPHCMRTAYDWTT